MNSNGRGVTAATPIDRAGAGVKPDPHSGWARRDGVASSLHRRTLVGAVPVKNEAATLGRAGPSQAFVGIRAKRAVHSLSLDFNGGDTRLPGPGDDPALLGDILMGSMSPKRLTASRQDDETPR